MSDMSGCIRLFLWSQHFFKNRSTIESRIYSRQSEAEWERRRERRKGAQGGTWWWPCQQSTCSLQCQHPLSRSTYLFSCIHLVMLHKKRAFWFFLLPSCIWSAMLRIHLESWRCSTTKADHSIQLPTPNIYERECEISRNCKTNTKTKTDPRGVRMSKPIASELNVKVGELLVVVVVAIFDRTVSRLGGNAGDTVTSSISCKQIIAHYIFVFDWNIYSCFDKKN